MRRSIAAISGSASSRSIRTPARPATSSTSGRETFIWTAHTENLGLSLVTWLDKSDEIIYASERDGWRHLYLVDAEKGEIRNQITKGEWVVRGIDRIDEDARQIWFNACGRNADQDPYFLHYYRVNFDGSGLVALTEGNGNHSIQYSPDRRYLIDTYSRVDTPPVHELRRVSDGKLVCPLEKADISELIAKGWTAPEVFVAKGRDGKTDIWGIICRPKDFDPGKKYPVIEQIYAGPQSSYVPKSFSPTSRFTSLTDLGFVVVQMDGMGTANRSKAFHDVCWHNLKDAGFPGSHPVASGRGEEISVVRHQPRGRLWEFRRRAERRRARCCSIPSSTRPPSPPAAATTTAWTRPPGTSSGWATRSGRAIPSARTSTMPTGSRASCS